MGPPLVLINLRALQLIQFVRSGRAINADWFALYGSRGLDSALLKTFMRATALVSEFLMYVPAVVIFVRIFGRQADLSKYDKVY